MLYITENLIMVNLFILNVFEIKPFSTPSSTAKTTDIGNGNYRRSSASDDIGQYRPDIAVLPGGALLLRDQFFFQDKTTCDHLVSSMLFYGKSFSGLLFADWTERILYLWEALRHFLLSLKSSFSFSWEEISIHVWSCKGLFFGQLFVIQLSLFPPFFFFTLPASFCWYLNYFYKFFYLHSIF